jgi:hypothetical protein
MSASLVVFIGIPPGQRAASATLSLDGRVLRHFSPILNGRGFKPLGVRVNLHKVMRGSFTLAIVERMRAGRTLRVSRLGSVPRRAQRPTRERRCLAGRCRKPEEVGFLGPECPPVGG